MREIGGGWDGFWEIVGGRKEYREFEGREGREGEKVGKGERRRG